jgi:hypothetical protein
MKKQIIIVLLGISTFASAQKNSWTVGLYTGVQGQIQTSILQEYFFRFSFPEERIIDEWNPTKVGIQNTFSRIPPVELTVKYNIGNHFSMATGVGYRAYELKVKYNSFYNYRKHYDYIQVPIIFQYDIPLKKQGFAFFVQGGFSVDFEADYRGWGWYYNEQFDYVSRKQCTVEEISERSLDGGGFNYLLHGGFGFSYTFRSGVGISLSGRYNIGSEYINQHSYHLVLKEVGTDIIEREIIENVYGKGECWNVFVGVSYTFKQKKNE